MQWEKLERSYAAAAKLLESLGPEDRFNLLLYNTRVESFQTGSSEGGTCQRKSGNRLVAAEPSAWRNGFAEGA